MKYYTFTINIGAEAETVDEAWERALEGFVQDPGTPEQFTEEEIEED